MRQLDLFGIPIEPVKKQAEEVVTVETADAVIEVEASTLAKEEQVVYLAGEQQDEQVKLVTVATNNADSTLIFDDGKIAVKIKAKRPVPTNEVSDVVLEQQEPATAVVTVSRKRGRKSFKEMDEEVEFIELPDDEDLFKKQYYPISQVAKWFNVNNSLLRFWETEFDILKPRKNRKGDRLFRPEDVKNLQIIYYLLRQRKFTIEGAKEYLKINKGKADSNIQLIKALTKFKSFLLELRINLEA